MPPTHPRDPQVYAAQNRKTGELVAVKSINHAKLVNSKLEENLDTEIKILQQSRHTNIVALYDVLVCFFFV